MNIENTGFEKLKVDLDRLDDTMEEHGLIRGGHWDYERVTYDRKFELNEGIYYLRLRGYAVDGDVGAHKATIQLMTPLLGKYYFPHGVEYGTDEVYPDSLLDQCQKIIAALKADLEKFAL